MFSFNRYLLLSGLKHVDFVLGEDCSQVAERGYWEVVQTKDFVPEGSASHTSVVWRDSLYIVGGESYKRAQMIYVYDFNGKMASVSKIIIGYVVIKLFC